MNQSAGVVFLLFVPKASYGDGNSTRAVWSYRMNETWIPPNSSYKIANTSSSVVDSAPLTTGMKIIIAVFAGFIGILAFVAVFYLIYKACKRCRRKRKIVDTKSHDTQRSLKRETQDEIPTTSRPEEKASPRDKADKKKAIVEETDTIQIMSVGTNLGYLNKNRYGVKTNKQLEPLPTKKPKAPV